MDARPLPRSDTFENDYALTFAAAIGVGSRSPVSAAHA